MGLVKRSGSTRGDWNKPPTPGGGGREKRLLIPGLDRLLSAKQVTMLMEGTDGARRRC